MDGKIQVIETIKDAEQKAKTILQDALQEKEKILQKAAEKAQQYEKREIEKISQQIQEKISAASHIEATVDTKEIKKLRSTAEKRIPSAVQIVWKEFLRFLE